MDLAAGTRVGPYEIDRKIGAGGMGVVYGARDERLGRQVAIKVLPAAVIGDADRLRRFEQEARTVGGLNHPNLVILHDVGRHDGAPYLVTELLAGTSLRARIADGPLALREVMRIAVDIARGLNAAHGSGIVHRDIKPDNVFLTRDGRVKILDFGIAKLRDVDAATAATAATGSGVVIGTPGYMAPEQLAGGAIDARTDLFALGVVIFEMLTRRRPFAADNQVEEQYGVMKGAPQALPASVPAAVAKIVMRCLEKRPDDRFQSAADLAFALESLDEVASGRLATPARGVPIRAGSEAFAATAVSSAAGPTGAVSASAVTAAPASGGASGAAPIAQLEGTRSLPQVVPPATQVAPPRARISLAMAAVLIAALACITIGALAFFKSRSPKPLTYATASAAHGDFPTLVPGGPQYSRVSYHAQQKWFARFADDGRSVLYSRRALDGDRKPSEDWEIVRSTAGSSTVLPIGMQGRLLDVAANGELAIRLKGSGSGGILARGQVGGAQPRRVAEHVEDAAWLPSGDLVVLRGDGQSNVVEYPIDHPLITLREGVLAALRASHSGKLLGLIVEAEPDDTRGRVAIYRLDGVELAHSQIYAGIEGIAFAGDELWFSTNDTLRALAPDGHERVIMRSYGRLQLRDVAPDGRILVAPSDTRYHMYERTNADPEPERGEQIDWLDESVVKSISAHGDDLAFLQISDAGLTPEGYATFFLRGKEAPVQIGNAFAVGLLPDGSQALLLSDHGAPLQIVPTAMGSPRPLPTGDIKSFDLNDSIAVAADGRHAVVRAAAADGEMRLWLLDLAGGAPARVGRPTARHGHHPISPDGEWIAVGDVDAIALVSTSGKPERKLAGSQLEPLQFSEDGTQLIVMNLHGFPRIIQEITLASGDAHELWRIEPMDRPRMFDAAVSADASTLVYSLSVEVADLYVIEPPSAR